MTMMVRTNKQDGRTNLALASRKVNDSVVWEENAGIAENLRDFPDRESTRRDVKMGPVPFGKRERAIRIRLP